MTPDEIRKLRKSSGLSQAKFARKAGVSVNSKPLPPVDSAGTGQAPATLKDDSGTAVKPPVQQNQEIPAAEGPAVMRGSFSALLDALDGIRRAVNRLAAKIDGAEALEARIRLLERDMDRMRGQLDQRKGAA